MDVMFTGGTGRSGTTIAAKLIGAHPGFIRIPFEAKFIAAKGGLCDLALGRLSYEQYERRLFRRWFKVPGVLGLDTIADRETVQTAIGPMKARLATDPWGACREFVHRLFDPIAARDGATGWVEMNPANAFRADHLQRMFPAMRLVHMYRDGRDVACSVTPLRWGPTDIDTGLDWWADRLERSFAAVGRVEAGRAMNLQLEDLIVRDREAEYRRLLSGLGLTDVPEMHAFFDAQLTEANAHVGRWLRDVPPDRLKSFEAHHERLAAGLIERGRPYVPLTREEVLAPV